MALEAGVLCKQADFLLETVKRASLGLAQFLVAPWLDHHSSLCFRPHADLPLWLSLFLL